MRDDKGVAIDALLELVAEHAFDRREAVERRQAHFRLIDADEVGARVLGDGVVAPLALLVWALTARNLALRQTMSTSPVVDHAMAEIIDDHGIVVGDPASDPVVERGLLVPPAGASSLR